MIKQKLTVSDLIDYEVFSWRVGAELLSEFVGRDLATAANIAGAMNILALEETFDATDVLVERRRPA